MRGSTDGTNIRRVRDKYYFILDRCSSDCSTNWFVCMVLGGRMKRVILEYAGAVIAVIGTIGFFAFLSNVFMGKEGVLALFISFVLGGL